MKWDQKVVDFEAMLDAIDVLCRFCPQMAAERCLTCGANLAVKENWEKLTPGQKERCDCPWNGIM
jgi:hypothetical protein